MTWMVIISFSPSFFKILLWEGLPFLKWFLNFAGTLLNSKSKISEKTAAALKEAVERGVKVFIATGKVK